MRSYVKRRGLPEPGSIPAVLDIFRSEVRFYQQIAPVIGTRVPTCYRAAESAEGTELVLEDLSDWRPGADPADLAGVLGEMHRRWENRAHLRWPWLRRPGAAGDLVEALLVARWPYLAERDDVTPQVAELGARLAGQAGRVEQAIIDAGRAGPPTLVHGDASAQNLRTSSSGEIALLDWEDVGASPGVDDLGWVLVSSTEPGRWGEVIEAYGSPVDPAVDSAVDVSAGLVQVLPSAVVQGLLSLDDTQPGDQLALGWIGRLEAAADMLAAAG
jgi:hypothetical protein